ncbi:nesprin-4 isoform X1 [Onychomys torridus]|uniref:nesprin-4 isoform X1 n=1 Tax=Onychomys torridus TaxID=38674 RepID=UPI00167F9BBF|nr:nesprin-4 isoform X1 [Onychomys torridus]
MALSPSLGHGFPSEPLNQSLGAPREPDITGCTIGLVPEETSRPEQAQASLGPPEHITGELKDTEPATGPPRLPLASSHEHQDGGKPCEHAVSGLEVLEIEQDSLRLCLLGLSFQLQDLEQGLGSWTLAHSRIVQLQALQAELRGAAERVDALLAFGEGLAETSEPRIWAPLERVLRALGTHRDTIFQRLWQLQAQLISYSLVLEKANLLDWNLEVEGDSAGPAPGGIWGPWAPSTLPTPAELEWDPAGDVGGLGPSGQKTSRVPGAPCELCGYRGPQGSGQGLEDLLTLGLSHRKHLAAHHRRRLRKPQDKKRQSPPSPSDVMLEVDHGIAPASASRWPLTLFFLILFFLLLGAALLPLAGVPCCPHARLAGTPYLVLSYVNGLPPI